MDIVIYHNPRCGKSRDALAMIRAAGFEPTIVEYLKAPPSRPTIKDLVRRMGVPLRSILRDNEPAYRELGLGEPGVSDDALLDAIEAHPILLNRPIVVTPQGAKLCRPSETVKDLLVKR